MRAFCVLLAAVCFAATTARAGQPGHDWRPDSKSTVEIEGGPHARGGAGCIAELIGDLRKQPKPYYPTAAKNDGLEGDGLCRVRFDTATGRVREVTVVHSSGYDILDDASVRVLRRWRFKPNTCDEIAVSFNYQHRDPGSEEIRDRCKMVVRFVSRSGGTSSAAPRRASG